MQRVLLRSAGPLCDLLWPHFLPRVPGQAPGREVHLSPVWDVSVTGPDLQKHPSHPGELQGQPMATQSRVQLDTSRMRI